MQMQAALRKYIRGAACIQLVDKGLAIAKLWIEGFVVKGVFTKFEGYFEWSIK